MSFFTILSQHVFPLVLHSFDSVPPYSAYLSLHIIALYSSAHLCHCKKRNEQHPFQCKGAPAKQSVKSSQHQWLCASPAPTSGDRQSGKDSSFPSNCNTPGCGETHGLPQNTTAPSLIQEFAGTRRLHTACRHSHSNPINPWRGVTGTQRFTMAWPRPRTVIDAFTFQEQFHRKWD